MIYFERDTVKATSNQKKHGISFEEARSVFCNELAVQFFNEDNSELEDRFMMLDFCDEARIPTVCHCERDQGNAIRIIPAKQATKNEGKYYQGVKRLKPNMIYQQ